MKIPLERWLYALTIGSSALLLFAVQPVLAKALLPRYGGAAGVWVTCMLFFQVGLLLGYFYSYTVTRLFSRRAQSTVHAVLLLASGAQLPLRLHATSAAAPQFSILGVLATTVGLPYLALSATSPLLQSWFARSYTAAFPYRLFAVSNAASLAALLAYPVAIEPRLAVGRQLFVWSTAYGAVLVLSLAAAAAHAARPPIAAPASEGEFKNRPWLWIALSACSSTLWLAVANHLSQEVAAVPFLWVLPLSLYLLSFILCFEGSGWYRPSVFRWLLPVAWLGASYGMAGRGTSGGLIWDIPIFSVALFLCCMFCHGELARTKPPAQRGLPFFYLNVALGGALGAVFVGLSAPALFHTFLELPIAITGCVLLALALLYGLTAPRRLARLAVVAVAAFIVASRLQTGNSAVVQERNFYGALQVSDSGAGETAIRTLYNGRTLHGIEFLSRARSRWPTAYFGPTSGAGRVLQGGVSPRRIAVVGLGAGTLAAYGRPGDAYRFYEINPAVIAVAERDFHFLDGSPARIEIVPGDGRLSLEREPAQSLDVLILDAFADDSIPVHLLTREAFTLYFKLLRPDGILALHITSRYLDLAPIVEALGISAGKRVEQMHNGPDPDRQILAADWAIVSGNAAARPAARLWTDDYSNLFQALK